MDVTKAYRNICRLCLGDDAVDVTHMKYKDKMLELLSASSGIVVSIICIRVNIIIVLGTNVFAILVKQVIYYLP